jgi:hypothetical protein
MVKLGSLTIIPKSGVYISVRKLYLFPPSPLLKMIFFPLSRHIVFRLPAWHVALILRYLHLFTLLFPLFSFSFPFLPFSFTFPPFFSSPFQIFFPQMTSADISPGGGGVFSNLETPVLNLGRYLCSQVNVNRKRILKNYLNKMLTPKINYIKYQLIHLPKEWIERWLDCPFIECTLLRMNVQY